MRFENMSRILLDKYEELKYQEREGINVEDQRLEILEQIIDILLIEQNEIYRRKNKINEKKD